MPLCAVQDSTLQIIQMYYEDTLSICSFYFFIVRVIVKVPSKILLQSSASFCCMIIIYGSTSFVIWCIMCGEKQTSLHSGQTCKNAVSVSWEDVDAVDYTWNRHRLLSLSTGPDTTAHIICRDLEDSPRDASFCTKPCWFACSTSPLCILTERVADTFEVCMSILCLHVYNMSIFPAYPP